MLQPKLKAQNSQTASKIQIQVGEMKQQCPTPPAVARNAINADHSSVMEHGDVTRAKTRARVETNSMPVPCASAWSMDGMLSRFSEKAELSSEVLPTPPFLGKIDISQLLHLLANIKVPEAALFATMNNVRIRYYLLY
jgi:hypothetical protein